MLGPALTDAKLLDRSIPGIAIVPADNAAGQARCRTNVLWPDCDRTRGVDIGSKRNIYDLLAELAGEGMAIRSGWRG